MALAILALGLNSFITWHQPIRCLWNNTIIRWYQNDYHYARYDKDYINANGNIDDIYDINDKSDYDNDKDNSDK